jgi:glycyl-tRNA synthetase beta chain
MSEFLLELYSEEIPARMLSQAQVNLERLFKDQLKKNDLAFSSTKTFATSMRLGITVNGLDTQQPDRKEERKGPRVDAPPKAIEGFLKSTGLTLDDCEIRETPKGNFYFAVTNVVGQPTKDILPGLLTEVLKKFVWPKSMRWNSYDFKWVRPLHNILAIFDGEALNGNLDLGGKQLVFTNSTTGHRFLAPQAITIDDYTDYQQKMRKAYIILDNQERQQIILDKIKGLLSSGLTLKEDPNLLEEVAGITEWPEVYLGEIDSQYMSVPKEVLMTAMRVHQKYFSVLTKDGNLAPYFLTVTNTIPSDGGKKIIEGNENILRSRLFDAKFYWEQDLKAPLSSLLKKLEGITYHAKLGSMFDKSQRLKALAGYIASQTNSETAKAERAAELCKCDLASGMVYEFPELQGIMGRYYAIKDQEDRAVADAISSHYAPLGPQDDCPTYPVSIAVALADKIDTLVGFFGVNQKPTGSKDPFALRRAALGAIRLILENKLRVSLSVFFKKSYDTYNGMLEIEYAELEKTLLSFFVDRLTVYLKDQGIRHDYINSVFALGSEDDLVRLINRVNALKSFLESDDGSHLLAAYRRAGNIIRIEEKKDGIDYHNSVETKLFAENEEKDLYAILTDVRKQTFAMIEAESYQNAMVSLIKLRQPIDTFFDKITVNTDEQNIRKNRLRLLSQIVTTFEGIADLGKIEG